MGRSLLVALTFAAACGRLGFDAVPGADETDADVPAMSQSLGMSATGGGVSASGSEARHGRIAVDPDGVPYVAWADASTGNWEIYLRYWDGADWVSLGGSGDPGGISDDPFESRLGEIAFDSQGRPHVVWMSFDSSANQRSIYYRYWDGATWAEVGGSASGRGVSQSFNPYWPKMAIVNDQPYITYETYNAAPQGAIHVKRLAGNVWEEIDGSATGSGIASGTGDSRLVSVASDGATLYVAWQGDGAGVNDAYVAQLGPAGWQPLGDSLALGGLSSSTAGVDRVAIRARSGRAIVSWTDTGSESSRLLYLESGTWTELGGSGSGPVMSDGLEPVFRLDTDLDADGNPLAAWTYPDAPADIFVSRWTGASWEPATTGAFYQTPGHSDYPRVAAADDGNVYVVWEEELAASQVEIYLRWLP